MQNALTHTLLSSGLQISNSGRTLRCSLPAVAWMLTVLCLSPLRAEDTIEYNRDIRPILSDRCFACHGPDEGSRAADLRLDDREAAIDYLMPGDAESSEILRRILSEDEDEVMPPRSTHKKVTKAEAEMIRRWIDEGAEYQGHWAFIAPERPEIPEVDPQYVYNPIDHLIVDRLLKNNLQPAPQANRETLIRRVTLDLIGLPPTPEEVKEFVDDPAPDDIAYEKVVDRLLDSPRWGIHFAWAWLDAARYADSDGYESDPLRNMWPWRDWVVEAFNSNMPFDQFVIEQLAGDMLPNPTVRQRLATGFNRNHRLNNEGGVLPEEWLIENVADRAETTATVFLGLTWACARCHDHKFDPITQKNYFELFAFFHNLDEIGNGSGASNAPPMIRVPSLDKMDEFERYADGFAKAEAALEARQREEEFKNAFEEWTKALSPEQQATLPGSLKTTAVDKWNNGQKSSARRHYLMHIDSKGVDSLASNGMTVALYDKFMNGSAKVMVMDDMPTPRKTHLLIRGAYDSPGEEVDIVTPTWLPPMDEDLPRNRLGLAKWLVDPKHPLTSRVTVNRYWDHYFGMGLVKTPEDFGSQSELPIHQDVLDWLALEFIDLGWDMKAIQKTIVMTRTYRQTSVVSEEVRSIDPENALLTRGPRLRLPAAVIRDQALLAGGLLVEEGGGPPVKTYQSPALWKEILKGGPTYTPDTGKNLYRRSIYTLWRRAVKPPQMMLLDANERDTCIVGQKRSNTPLQALLIMNDVTFVEAARGMAERMIKEGGETPAERLTYGMLLLESRSPRTDELEVLEDTLQLFHKQFLQNPKEAEELITFGESKPDASLDQVELAAYTAVARVLFNLDETVNKP